MFDSLFLCILDVAHDRILSVRTSYSQYFTNCYEATNLRYLLIYNYRRYFYTEYLLRGSFFLYPFPTILSGHKCILFCVLIITHKHIQSIRTPYTQFFTWYYKDFKFFCIQVLDIYFPKKLLKSNFFCRFIKRTRSFAALLLCFPHFVLLFGMWERWRGGVAWHHNTGEWSKDSVLTVYSLRISVLFPQ